MRHVAALVVSRLVAPYEEPTSRERDAREQAPVVQVAKRRRIWRRVRASDTWKPTYARA